MQIGKPHDNSYHHRDPRDHMGADFDAINATPTYVLYAVFKRVGSITQSDAQPLTDALSTLGVEVRGWYDVAGFKSDADVLVWLIHESPEVLQQAYHAILNSTIGHALDRVWSCMGVHRPAEFNSRHVPACLRGVHPRQWVCVYPFVRSYEWYLLDEKERSTMLREHGMGGMQYPDVKSSTIPTFALSDYEWILAFEADDLHRLTDVMRHQRSMAARRHVRVETPFYTGQRVELDEWCARQSAS